MEASLRDGRPGARPMVRTTFVTIPTADGGFRRHVEAILDAEVAPGPAWLERRLRVLYPRVVVRERVLDGERPTCYVYRDGHWQPPGDAPWWTQPLVARLELSLDGWVLDANPACRSLLVIDDGHRGDRYVTDFVAPGTLADVRTLFGIVAAGDPVEATVRLRPLTGEVIAVDLRATRDGERIACALRVAADIGAVASPRTVLPRLRCLPADDTLFARYVQAAARHLPEASADELAIRLHRLYPHARVVVGADGWEVRRDADPATADAAWWMDPSLPAVLFDDRGLLLAANAAAEAFLGPGLVGRHWHELVTPGTTAEVDEVIALLMDQGRSVSRFRLPRPDGSLVEFDAYTEPADGALRGVMRPLGPIPPPAAAPATGAPAPVAASPGAEMDWSHAATIMLDREGRYLDADPVALELLGVDSVEALRALPPDAFAPVPPDPEEQAAWREAYFASRAEGVLGEGAFRRPDGELVRVRTAILEEPDGRFRALFYPVERHTTNLAARTYRIGDVLAEWRSAERHLAEVDPSSDEGRAVQAEVELLRAQYQELVQRASRPR